MTQERNLVAYPWLALGGIAAIAGVVELFRIGFGSTGAALSMYALVVLGAGIVAASCGALRKLRAARIGLIVLLGLVAAYCGLFSIWIGAAYGFLWLGGAIVMGLLAVGSIFLIRASLSE